MTIDTILSRIIRETEATQAELRKLKTQVVLAPLNAGPTIESTIAAGAIAATRPHISLIPQSGTADDLDTINNPHDGKVVVLSALDSGDTITVRDVSVSITGNIRMRDGANKILSNQGDSLALMYKESTGYWEQIAASGSSLVETFLELTDTPAAYTGAGGQFVKVKVAEDGLEFVAGSGGAVDSVNGQTGVVVLDTDDIAEGVVNFYFTDERAQDAVGLILTDSTTIDFTYDDATPSITAIVIDGSITFAKMQDIATDTLIGRDTAGTGDPEAITLDDTLSMTGAGALQRAALTGDVTAAAGDNATTIANDAVTFAKMQNIVTDSLIGRDTASTGDPENITLNATLSMTGAGALQRAALTGDVTAAAGDNATLIANDVVTNAKLANMAANTVKANVTGSAADPSDVGASAFLHQYIDASAAATMPFDGAEKFPFTFGGSLKHIAWTDFWNGLSDDFVTLGTYQVIMAIKDFNGGVNSPHVRALNTNGLYFANSLDQIAVFIDHSLFVGIGGNTSPASDLHVGDGTGNRTIAIDGAAGAARSVAFRTAGVNRWLYQVTATAEGGSNTGSNFALLRRDDAGAAIDTAFFINRATGNVGLGGNTSPAEKLDVAGTIHGNENVIIERTSGTTVIRATSSVATTGIGSMQAVSDAVDLRFQAYGSAVAGTRGGQAFANAGEFVVASGDKFLITVVPNSPLHFLTNAAVRMTILGGGNVGIGETTPTGKLHVEQSSLTGAIPTLWLRQADLSEEFIRFEATVAAGNPLNTTALGSYYGRARVYVEGVGEKWLALYNT